MPTYQYVCTECGGQLEAVQKFTDEPLTVHEDCGGRLRKVFSPVGIVFKGSGFYRTDSRGSGAVGCRCGLGRRRLSRVVLVVVGGLFVLVFVEASGESSSSSVVPARLVVVQVLWRHRRSSSSASNRPSPPARRWPDLR